MGYREQTQSYGLRNPTDMSSSFKERKMKGSTNSGKGYFNPKNPNLVSKIRVDGA